MKARADTPSANGLDDYHGLSTYPPRFAQKGNRLSSVVQHINQCDHIKATVLERQCATVKQGRPRPDYAEIDDIHLRDRSKPEIAEVLSVVPGPAADIQDRRICRKERCDAAHEAARPPGHEAIHQSQRRPIHEMCRDSRCARCGGARPKRT